MKALFWGFFVVGFIAVIMAVYYGADTYIFTSGARQAIGTVDTLIEVGKTGEKGEYSLTTPTVAFSLPDGSIIRFRSGSSNYPPAYPQGAEVPVLYRPEQPQNARIDSFTELYFSSTVAACIGIVFVVGALLMRRFGRKGWGVYRRERQ